MTKIGLILALAAHARPPSLAPAPVSPRPGALQKNALPWLASAASRKRRPIMAARPLSISAWALKGPNSSGLLFLRKASSEDLPRSTGAPDAAAARARLPIFICAADIAVSGVLARLVAPG